MKLTNACAYSMRGKVIYMKDNHIQSFVIQYLKTHITKEDTVIDATVGNGFDTVLLASLAKQVIGFDIQKIAIDRTLSKLAELSIHNVTLKHASFENMVNHENIKGTVFNLGYLPNGDKSITTNADIALNTLKKIVLKMRKDDFILITAYPGHPEGKNEADMILSYVRTLPNSYLSLIYQIQNRNNAPFVIIIECL